MYASTGVCGEKREAFGVVVSIEVILLRPNPDVEHNRILFIYLFARELDYQNRITASSVQRPVSSVQCPASSVQCPVSSVQCPVSSVQRPQKYILIFGEINFCFAFFIAFFSFHNSQQIVSVET
ncbi:Hypothetical predicted protein [Octopus vulgaris]|uniref:Uncharacterized protein n=1 Tax=Octopus vulgaris TaxID=6645 RepID=A0AA36BGU7_OCTVU|nr:Hypothetical predicted protein [Octopus vulgaris]